MDQLSIFDELDAEREAVEKAKRHQLLIDARERAGVKKCEHCGDIEPNEYILGTNHANGWAYPDSCIRHDAMFMQASWRDHPKWKDDSFIMRAEEWLTRKGFRLPIIDELQVNRVKK